MNDKARFLATHSEFECSRWESSQFRNRLESVAEEIPVALIYNGLPHVVMMASPSDLEDFALGFSLSEGILGNAVELHAITTTPAEEGVEIRMDIDLVRYLPLEEQRRNLAGRTGCGLCGAETFEQAVRHPPAVSRGSVVKASVLGAAFDAMAPMQVLNQLTGAVHAAAWATPDGTVHCVREDVGRHNALDKMIGARTREGVGLQGGMALITSRASFEMVQKAATVGIEILAAISAPTALAIRLATETGVTLVAFSRDGRFNVYTHPERVIA